MTARPNMSFGNTLTLARGQNVFDAELTTELDSSKYGRNIFTDQVEFTDFEHIIKDYVLGSLGFPVVKVELHPFQIKLAIDEALTKMDYYAPFYCYCWATFTTSAGINGYELPTFVMNGLQNVLYKKTLLSIASQEKTLERDLLIKYFQENFLFNNFSIGDFWLFNAHLNTLRKVLGREGTYNVLGNQYVWLFPQPDETEEVIVEYRALNHKTIHPYLLNWIQRYALAHAKEILGVGARGKYSVLPSPEGGAQLNGKELSKDAKEEKQKLETELITNIGDMPFIDID